MLNVSYENWEKICNAYKDIRNGTKKSYLQWYPLSNHGMLNYFKNREFFEKYIKTGYLFTDSKVLHIMKHFLQKQDGTFRDAQLVSPILYLLVQTICYEIFERCELVPQNTSVYYAGDFETLDLHYFKSYDKYYKQVNYASESYSYFIKVDITDFFRSINLDILFNDINNSCIKDTFTENELYIFKEIFSYCGEGKYPILENSTGLSFLATKVFLNDCDNQLSTYLSNNEEIDNYSLIRYVDDLYIVLNLKEGANIDILASELINTYSTILEMKGLRINSSKTEYGETKNIDVSLKKSLYDEIVNGEIFELHKESFEMLKTFLKELSDFVRVNKIVIADEYDRILASNFIIPGSNVSSRELFLKSIYNCSEIVDDSDIINHFQNLNKLENYRYDTKMLVTLLLKTKDNRLIKELLNELFIKSRNSKWSKTDVYVAIIYLLNRNFSHEDLLSYIESENFELFSYIRNYCQPTKKFIDGIRTSRFEKLKITGNTMKLYLLYKIEESRNNHLHAFAYYKNYFDAMTAEIDFYCNPKGKAVRYQAFYHEKNLNKYYFNNKKIKGTITIINKAHSFRNENPLNHGSAELLRKANPVKKELYQCIDELDTLLQNKIDEVLKESIN